MESGADEQLVLVLKQAFGANVRQGPLCLEPMRGVAVVCQFSQKTVQHISSTEDLCKVLSSRLRNMWVPAARMWACLLEEITQQVRLALEMSPLRVLEKYYKI